MPVTFNPNNNYNVEIVQEPNVGGSSPSSSFFEIKNSNGSIPGYVYGEHFVEMKITPTNPQTRPVLACNLEFDKSNNGVPKFTHNGANYQSLGVSPCDPPLPPYAVNSNFNVTSSLEHFHSIYRAPGCGVTTIGGTGQGDFFGNSFNAQQGPYFINYDPTLTQTQVQNSKVGVTKIVFIEIYEDDNGNLVNDNFSPDIESNWETWPMWDYQSGPPVTNNVYPVFIKAFVFLDTQLLSSITTNTTLFIDIDETQPVYGCNDTTASNYEPAATVNNGSCLYPPVANKIIIKDVGNTMTSQHGNYIDPPFPSQVISMPQLGLTTQDLSGLPVMPKNLAISQRTTIVNGQTIIPEIVLANTYFDGDYVNELVHIKLFPRQKIVNTPGFFPGSTTPITSKALAVFDFPLPGGPNTNYQASLPVGDPLIWMGQALNNLTGAGVSILNNGIANSGRPNYVAVGSTSGYSQTQAEPTRWWPTPHLDVNGNVPTTIMTWDVPNNSIDCVQPDGSVLT